MQRNALPVLLAALLLIATTQAQTASQADLQPLLDQVSAAYAKLEPQTIRPAEGYLKYDYLIPAGYYKQMWDWDGFFIGAHLAHQRPENAKYLRGWVLSFAAAADGNGYVPGLLTADKLPLTLEQAKAQPIFGLFEVKPFLAQGALLASGSGDAEWVRPAWQKLRLIEAYRERTQRDAKTGLFFWESAMQSGEDNNLALTNDPKQKNAILAVDLCTFQLREYEAMATLAAMLGKPAEASEFQRKAQSLRKAMRKRLWFKQDAMFWNVRRDTGQPVRVMSGANFLPLAADVLTPAEARAMIQRHLLDPAEMWAPYGIRSLSKQDPGYNNVSMITPYSNWQGPVWMNTNFLFYSALRRYGFTAHADQLAATLGKMVLADIAQWRSMHECYDAETGLGLAPTAEQSRDHVFTGFVGWNLLVEDMLECSAKGDCLDLATNNRN
jgi:alpha,alpha-trehalase